MAALAGDARALVVGAAAVRWRSSILPFSLANAVDRRSTRWPRRSSGAGSLFGIPFHLAHPGSFVARAAGDDLRAGPARARARVDVRPLPPRERALEHARVPGLARHRRSSSALAPPGLDAADLLGAAADLGLPRDPRTRRSAARLGPASACRSPSALVYVAIATCVPGSSSTAARERATLSLT